MARGAYISGWGAYLPNAPIENQQIEDVLGHMKSQSAAVKRRVLINNGITRRYYAIDPATGAATHTNARLTAEAIKNLCQTSGFLAADIQCLSCGTGRATRKSISVRGYKAYDWTEILDGLGGKTGIRVGSRAGRRVNRIVAARDTVIYQNTALYRS